jgi:hypothetical protein
VRVSDDIFHILHNLFKRSDIGYAIDSSEYHIHLGVNEEVALAYVGNEGNGSVIGNRRISVRPKGKISRQSLVTEVAERGNAFCIRRSVMGGGNVAREGLFTCKTNNLALYVLEIGNNSFRSVVFIGRAKTV